ncbi:EamA family transporter [Geomicrobium sp. JCM 19055]|uniref:EamA family transporter n=1 Tax=Geomicrobium sp. JCM 19055 TaxID=1460649 RepID=UPI00045EDACE|nr:EamA family transporter [Geomicrobium sp. JCM 19055]GAJ97383.1 predicted permease [Geomicrobium sp. JCM 19055]
MAIISQLILLILLFTLLGSVGAYYFKRATSEGIGLHRTFIQNLMIGGAAYGTGALLNIYVLQFLPYTVVFPLTSITYLWTFALAAILLRESITLRKLIGATLIIIGAALLIM